MRHFFIIILLLPLSLYGQKMNIGYLYPAGGNIGSSVDVVVGGQNLKDITGVLVSGEGITGSILETPPPPAKGKKKKRKITDEDNLQIEEKVIVRLTLSKQCKPGVRDFRLVTNNGYSNRLFFEVSQYDNLCESGDNNIPAQATPVPVIPAVLNGQVMAGTRDYFTFDAHKGQTIVCGVKARALMPYLADAVPGWFQPVLALYDSQGKEVAYNDDNRFDPDPLIICKIPKDDKYTVEIKDAIYRGRADFVYRITVGEIPYIRSIYPLGGYKNKKNKVSLEGVNLASNTITVKPGKKAGERFLVRQKGTNGFLSNAVPFEINSGANEIFENEKDKKGMKNAPLLLPDEVVNGKIDSIGDVDWYAFEAKKGEIWAVKLSARKFGSSLDARLSLYDSQGKRLLNNDDLPDKSEGIETHHADAGMVYRIKEPGMYYIRVIDSQNKGGNDYAYRLSVGENQPDYELRIEPSNLTIPQGGTGVFSISAIRKSDFRGEIEISAQGLSNNYKLSRNIINKGDKQLRMTITAPENAPLGKLDVKFVGTAIGKNGTSIVKEAQPAEEMTQAFYINHLIPTSSFLINVSEPLPFSIIPEKNNKPIELQKDTTVQVKININYKNGFDQPIQIILNRPPQGVKMKPISIEPGQKEAIAEIEYLGWGNVARTNTLVFMGMVKPQKFTGKTLGNAVNNISAALSVFSPGIEVILPPAPKPEKKKQ